MTTALTDLSDIEIRRYRYDSEVADRIAEVCRLCFADPWSREAVESTMRAEQNYVVAAEYCLSLP